jgi:hypothetical protein
MFGVCKVYLDGGLDAQTYKLDLKLGSRTVGIRKVVKRHASAECVGLCIEEPVSEQCGSAKALLPMLGAAVFACELEGLPYHAAVRANLKIKATGKLTTGCRNRRPSRYRPAPNGTRQTPTSVLPFNSVASCGTERLRNRIPTRIEVGALAIVSM